MRIFVVVGVGIGRKYGKSSLFMYREGGKLISRCRDMLIWEGKNLAISAFTAQGRGDSCHLSEYPSSLQGFNDSMKPSEGN